MIDTAKRAADGAAQIHWMAYNAGPKGLELCGVVPCQKDCRTIPLNPNCGYFWINEREATK